MDFQILCNPPPLTPTEIVYERPLNHFWAKAFRVLCTFQSVQFVPALRVQYTIMYVMTVSS